MRIKKGDPVIVIAGKKDDKGKVSKVTRVFPKTKKVTVEGVAMVTKHDKRTKTKVQFERAIDVSNVAYAVDGKPSRIGYDIVDGKKVRVLKKTGQRLK